ncbi:protein ALP1-like [Amaranthus tricolor]|uniref:protein ALP1-like n=1 Tax=Amaranthus tricolor TaxID=29722 RepID=UPI0025865E51|nr:protein ALP1-like [Amaranthus tricolor]
MNDRICKEQLRMDQRYFDKLCEVLVTRGDLVTTRNVTNRTIGAVFTRSGETVSRQFHTVLKVVMKIGKYYIKLVDFNVTYDGDNKWKWFEGALGALDGTLIKMTVPVKDRPRYRDRKGDITTNVLATCDPSLRFNHVLPGWEGSTSDPRILGDALRRPNGLKVPRNKYFLVHLGYSNAQGFLAPYKGIRYHLNLWRGSAPTNYKELFNLRHSSARNTIERAFGLLKMRWAILRKSSFYDKQTQVRIINACFFLHNFVREENLDDENLLNEVDDDLSNVEAFDTMEDEGEDFILTAQASPQWNNLRDEMSQKMFREY